MGATRDEIATARTPAALEALRLRYGYAPMWKQKILEARAKRKAEQQAKQHPTQGKE